MASVVLAIVAASATLPVIAGVQNIQEAERLRHAVEIGQALMDEIRARPFGDVRVPDKTRGPSGLEISRLSFLNVDAFHGFSESDKVLRTYEGVSIAEETVNGFWRSVTADYVNFAGQYAGDTDAFVLVRVDVYHGTTLMASFSRLMSAEE